MITNIYLKLYLRSLRNRDWDKSDREKRRPVYERK